MSNGWKAFCYIAAVVCFVIAAVLGYVVAQERRITGWQVAMLGLALGFLPAAWDAAEAT